MGEHAIAGFILQFVEKINNLINMSNTLLNLQRKKKLKFFPKLE